MSNTIRKNARTVTITFDGEADCWSAVVSVPRPSRGADATRDHYLNISELGSWLSAYAACLSATTNTKED